MKISHKLRFDSLEDDKFSAYLNFISVDHSLNNIKLTKVTFLDYIPFVYLLNPKEISFPFQPQLSVIFTLKIFISYDLLLLFISNLMWQFTSTNNNINKYTYTHKKKLDENRKSNSKLWPTSLRATEELNHRWNCLYQPSAGLV